MVGLDIKYYNTLVVLAQIKFFFENFKKLVYYAKWFKFYGQTKTLALFSIVQVHEDNPPRQTFGTENNFIIICLYLSKSKLSCWIKTPKIH